MKKILYVLSALAFILFGNNISAQENGELWVPVNNLVGPQIYVDIQGLDGYKGEDFFVWTVQDNDPPFELEGVRKEIYKTKTYYLIHKEQKKYSIAEVIYYDEDNNVITSYSYKINRAIPSYTYNYPIYEDSDQEAVYNKCMEYIRAADN